LAVCGILLVCLAVIELPELITLTNDTSNDFTTFLQSSSASLVVHISVAHQQEAPGATPLLILNRRNDRFLAVVDTGRTQTPRDPLELHSFWRT
jgi:hypothetical protein